jgi:hypothetical protein
LSEAWGGFIKIQWNMTTMISCSWGAVGLGLPQKERMGTTQPDFIVEYPHNEAIAGPLFEILSN